MMQEATFCDWLINRGVQFHPDTVIVDITSLSESWNHGIHNSNLDPIGSMALPPYEYMFFEWERPINTTPRYGVYLQHRKEPFYSNFRDVKKFHHWGATVLCISFITFSIPGNEPYIHISDDVFFYEINQQGICDTYPSEMVYDGMGKDEIFCQYKGRNIFESEFYSKNWGIEFDWQYRYYVHNAIYGIRLFYKKRKLELVGHTRQKRRRIIRQTGKAPSPYFRILDASDTPCKRYTGSGVSTGKKLDKVHIVRGHFRINSPDHPIAQFAGKTLWIPSHMKGKGTDAPPPRYKIVLRDGSDAKTK